MQGGYQEGIQELNTRCNNTSVIDFLNSVVDKTKRDDFFLLFRLMKQLTKSQQALAIGKSANETNN